MNCALQSALPLASVLLVGAISSTALAKVTYRGDVPNGYVFDCDTCHDDVPSLNWFGVDVALANDEALGVDWSAVWWIDSDGDGLTNGQELGDVCGDWTGDEDPAITEADGLSNPGDADSITGDPPSADCGDTGGTGAADDGQDEEASGCLYSTLGRTRSPGGLGLLGVAWILLVLRRRGGR